MSVHTQAVLTAARGAWGLHLVVVAGVLLLLRGGLGDHRVVAKEAAELDPTVLRVARRQDTARGHKAMACKAVAGVWG